MLTARPFEEDEDDAEPVTSLRTLVKDGASTVPYRGGAKRRVHIDDPNDEHHRELAEEWIDP